MAAFVRETEGGWEVVDGEAVLSTHVSQRAALRAALATYKPTPKDVVLRTADGEPNGAWRWIQAATAEDEPASDGKRISEATLDDALAHLNSSPRARVIDGGSPDSETHGSEFTAGATLATGWAHGAVRALTSLGRACLYVWAEVLPALADALDTGRIAFASIAVRGRRGDDGEIADARFSSLALTNLAVADDLRPTSAIRADEVVEIRITSPIRSLPEILMPKLTLRAIASHKSLALRGPAADKVIAAAALFGVTPEEEFDAEQYDSPTVAKFCAVRAAAVVEKALEAVPATEAPAARAAVNVAVRSVLGLRAEVADDLLAAYQALATAHGLAADASAADVTAAAKKMAAEKPEEGAEGSAEKSEAAATRSEKAIEARIAQLEAQSARVAMRAHVETEFAKAKATLPAEIDTLVDDLLATRSEALRGRLLSLTVKTSIGGPPTLRSIPKSGSEDVEADAHAPEMVAKRAAALVPDLRKQFPGEPEHYLVARAQKIAASRAA